jgi:hypothetical protein
MGLRYGRGGNSAGKTIWMASNAPRQPGGGPLCEPAPPAARGPREQGMECHALARACSPAPHDTQSYVVTLKQFWLTLARVHKIEQIYLVVVYSCIFFHSLNYKEDGYKTRT